MADIITDGWLILTDGSNTLKLFAEFIMWDYVCQGRIKHYDAGVNVYIPVCKEYLVVVAEGIWLNTHQKLTDCIDYLKDFQKSGVITVSILRDGTNYIECDGDSTSFSMNLKSKIQGAEKVSPGSQQYYRIERLHFEESG